MPRKNPNTFSPEELSWPQIVKNKELFKDFFACRIVLAADQQYPEFIQRVFHRQTYLSLKSSTTWKNSKTFSPAEFSQTQTINNMEIIKVFSPAKLSWPQNITIPKTFKDFFACRILLDKDRQQPGNIQRLFPLQICLGCRLSIPRKYSKTFSPAELSQPQMINIMGVFKSFPHAELSQAQIINNLKKVNDIFTGRNISVSNYQQHGKIQRFFCLQNCLSRRSSIPRKYSNSFSPAELSQPQIINNMEVFKSFPHAELSQPEIINNLEIVNDIFTGRNISVSNYQQHGIIQSFFRLQICLSRK